MKGESGRLVIINKKGGRLVICRLINAVSKQERN